MTVGEMQERMSHREFLYWQALYARRAQREELAAKTGRNRRA